MNASTAGSVAVIASYAIGSLPFGYFTARFVAGTDIRKQGSGNIGATNIARVLGTKWGMLVLLLDCLKGLLPVLLLPRLLVAHDEPSFVHVQVQVLCGGAAIAGHMFPCWLGFRGGKGVATTLGVILVLSWEATLGAVAVFAVSFAASRIVSLSSMLAAIAFAGCQLWLLGPHPFSHQHWSLAAFSLFVPTLIVIRHRTNVMRILRGEEPRFRAGRAPRD